VGQQVFDTASLLTSTVRQGLAPCGFFRSGWPRGGTTGWRVSHEPVNVVGAAAAGGFIIDRARNPLQVVEVMRDTARELANLPFLAARPLLNLRGV
jgi:hypothetical protein